MSKYYLSHFKVDTFSKDQQDLICSQIIDYLKDVSDFSENKCELVTSFLMNCLKLRRNLTFMVSVTKGIVPDAKDFCNWLWKLLNGYDTPYVFPPKKQTPQQSQKSQKSPPLFQSHTHVPPQKDKEFDMKRDPEASISISMEDTEEKSFSNAQFDEENKEEENPTFESQLLAQIDEQDIEIDEDDKFVPDLTGLCIHQTKCKNPNCTFKHYPVQCKFDGKCTKVDCPFYHVIQNEEKPFNFGTKPVSNFYVKKEACLKTQHRRCRDDEKGCHNKSCAFIHIQDCAPLLP
eukprot:TRINITY_DN2746_c1_g2_i1.p1 TRINITY_DN2746_c1_g2~~TRINITY_DN2746_c1_g2_i1.p1  ORF type:complete len:307 (+),score=68.93 TRINITY_DN2746_c1_g2_i1:57-923(+)